METRLFEEFQIAFQKMIDVLVGRGKGEGEGKERGSESGREEEGERVRSEKSSKTDSESQSSDDSGSDSSDDSSPSTNHNPTEDHVTKMVVEATTEAAQLANQIADLEVYDPGYPEVTLAATLSLFCGIVEMKDRLHEAQLLQEVGHVIQHDVI